MNSFIVHDSTGNVVTTYKVGNMDVSSVMAANVPSGLSGMLVDDHHDVLFNQPHWGIVDGVLTKIKQITAAAPDPLTASATAQAITFSGQYLGSSYDLHVTAPDGTTTKVPSTSLANPTTSGFSATLTLDKSGTHTAQVVYPDNTKSNPITINVG